MSSTEPPSGTSSISATVSPISAVSVPNSRRPSGRLTVSRSTRKSYTTAHGWSRRQLALGLGMVGGDYSRGARQGGGPSERRVDAAGWGILAVRRPGWGPALNEGSREREVHARIDRRSVAGLVRAFGHDHRVDADAEREGAGGRHPPALQPRQ